MADSTVTIVGNLTRDPEIRYTTGGAAKASFGGGASGGSGGGTNNDDDFGEEPF
jgi:single-stranded DNA-binding protein